MSNKSEHFEDFNEFLIESLRNKKLAEAYLDTALEEFIQDHNKASFLRALHDVAVAQGGLSKLSKKTSLNRQNLYKALSEKGNPTIDTIGSIIKALGLRMTICADHNLRKAV